MNEDFDMGGLYTWSDEDPLTFLRRQMEERARAMQAMQQQQAAMEEAAVATMAPPVAPPSPVPLGPYVSESSPELAEPVYGPPTELASPELAEPVLGPPVELASPELAEKPQGILGAAGDFVSDAVGGAADLAGDVTSAARSAGAGIAQDAAEMIIPGAPNVSGYQPERTNVTDVVQGVGDATVDAYNTDIPYYSDFARETLIPAVSSGISLTGAPAAIDLVTGIDSKKISDTLASAVVPVTAGDVALEASPIGLAGDVAGLVKRAGPGVLPFADDAMAAVGRFMGAGDELLDTGIQAGVRPGANNLQKAIDDVAEQVKPVRTETITGPFGRPTEVEIANDLSYDQIKALSKATGIGITGIRQAPDPVALIDEAIGVHRQARTSAVETLNRLNQSPPSGPDPEFSKALDNANKAAKGAAMKLNALEKARISLIPEPTDLEAQLRFSREALEANPDLAKQAFAANAVEKGKEIAAIQQAKSVGIAAQRRAQKQASGGASAGPVGETTGATPAARGGTSGGTSGVVPPGATPPTAGGGGGGLLGDGGGGGLGGGGLGGDDIPLGPIIPDPSNLDGVLREWSDVNRGILDKINVPSGPPSIVRSAVATIAGDFKDSFLTALTHRKWALEEELSRIVPDEALRNQMVKTATDAELDLHYGTNQTARKAAADILNQANEDAFKYNTTLQGAQDTVDRVKNSMFGLDVLGVAGQQGLTAIREGGLPIVIGSINRLLSAAHLPSVRTYLNNGITPAQESAMAGLRRTIDPSGLNPSAGTLLSQIPGPTRFLDQKAVVPLQEWLADRQFRSILGTLRDLAYEGNLVMMKMTGTDLSNPAARLAAADNANAITSAAERATLPGRDKVESLGLVSKQMSRSQINRLLEMAHFLSPTASKEQRVLAAGMILSNAAFLLGVGKILNDQLGVGDFVMNPLEKGFGTITLPTKDSKGLNNVVSMFPQESFQRLLINATQAIKDGDEEAFRDATLKYLVGRSSIWSQLGMGIGGLATGKGAIGYDVEGRFRNDMVGKEWLNAMLPIPPWAKNIATGRISTSDTSGVPTFLLGQAGFQEYGRSRYAELNQMSKELTGVEFGQMMHHEQDEWLKSNPAAAKIYEDWVKENDSVSAGITRDKYKALEEIAPLANGNFYERVEYRKRAGEIVATARAAYEMERQRGNIKDFKGERSPAQIAEQGYWDALEAAYDPKTDKTDYDLQEKLGTDYLAKLSPELRDKVIKEISFSPDPTYGELLKARVQLKPLWDAEDRAFEAFKQTTKATDSLTQSAKDYDSYADFVKHVNEVYIEAIQKQVQLGTVKAVDADATAKSQATKYLNAQKLPDAREAYRAGVIKANPELMPVLQKWYPDSDSKYLREAYYAGGGR